MELKNETIDKISAYLGTRPWREVEPLMHEISEQIIAIQTQNEKATPKSEKKHEN